MRRPFFFGIIAGGVLAFALALGPLHDLGRGAASSKREPGRPGQNGSTAAATGNSTPAFSGVASGAAQQGKPIAPVTSLKVFTDIAAWHPVPAEFLSRAYATSVIGSAFSGFSSGPQEVVDEKVASLLQMTPEERGAVGAAVQDAFRAWSTTVRVNKKSDNEWTVDRSGDSVKRIRAQAAEKVRSLLGAERSHVLQALLKQDLDRFFSGDRMTLSKDADGNWELSANQRARVFDKGKWAPDGAFATLLTRAR